MISHQQSKCFSAALLKVLSTFYFINTISLYLKISDHCFLWPLTLFLRLLIWQRKDNKQTINIQITHQLSLKCVQEERFSLSSLGSWEPRSQKQSPAFYAWASSAFFFPKMLQDWVAVNALGVRRNTNGVSAPPSKAQLLPVFFSADSESTMGAFWGVDKGGEGRMSSASFWASCRSVIQASDGWPASEFAPSASAGFRVCSPILVLLIKDACQKTHHCKF